MKSPADWTLSYFVSVRKEKEKPSLSLLRSSRPRRGEKKRRRRKAPLTHSLCHKYMRQKGLFKRFVKNKELLSCFSSPNDRREKRKERRRLQKENEHRDLYPKSFSSRSHRLQFLFAISPLGKTRQKED